MDAHDGRLGLSGLGVLRARRPDPARDPGPPGHQRRHRDRVGGPVRDEPAGDLQTPQGARAGRAHLPRSRPAAPPVPPGAPAAERHHRVARGLSAVLGGELPAPRRAAAGDLMTELTVTMPTDREIVLTRSFAAPAP